MTATREYEYSALAPVLYLAFELGNLHWKLGFTIGMGQRPRERNIAAGDLAALEREIRRAKRRFGLPEETPVLSCYEAGRDGFWLHRYLVAQGVENLVVDSSSIEVNRRQRRAKTDHMDVGKLLGQLIRFRSGEQKVWSVVRVPSVKDEDDRQLHRELTALKKDRTRHTNRIKGLLTGQGVRLPVKADFLERLERTHTWDGSSVPPRLQARLVREVERLELVGQQIKELEAERVEAIRHSQDPKVGQVRDLLRLNGIGQPVLAFRAREQLLDVRHGVLRLAAVPHWQGGGGPLGPDAHAVPEWIQPSRTGDEQGREPPCPGHGHRDRVGMAALSTGERAHQVV